MRKQVGRQQRKRNEYPGKKRIHQPRRFESRVKSAYISAASNFPSLKIMPNPGRRKTSTEIKLRSNRFIDPCLKNIYRHGGVPVAGKEVEIKVGEFSRTAIPRPQDYANTARAGIKLHSIKLFFNFSYVVFEPCGLLSRKERPTSNIQRPTSN